MNDLPPLFLAPPAVYAVGSDYQVFVPVSAECTMALQCGERICHDHANGILRSAGRVRRVPIPARELDEAKSFTVILRPIIERKPYFTETGPVQTLSVRFNPCAPAGAALRLVHVADTHSLIDEAVAAAIAAAPEKPDVLILNGDIPEDCGSEERMLAPHLIAGRISGGAFPCIFSRGNHDLRGVCAERYAELTPTDGGRSYFEFRCGPLWGVVLDLGEDKPDDHPEYGYTVCCSEFRQEQDAWLRRIARRGAPTDALWRIVLCHNPLSFVLPPPFDIERALRKRWLRLLGHLRPQAMLTGHLHECWAEHAGGPHDDLHSPCPVVCASAIDRKTRSFTCGDIEIGRDGEIGVSFVDETGKRTAKTHLKPQIVV